METEDRPDIGETENQPEIQPDKYKYDLRSATTGAIVGAAVVGAAGTGTGTVVGAAIFGDADPKPRHYIIGALASLAISSVYFFGAFSGYNHGKEAEVTPFQTETDRGVVVERNDGTQIPYVIDASGNYILFRNARESALISTSETSDAELRKIESEYRTRESQIFDSIKDIKEER